MTLTLWQLRQRLDESGLPDSADTNVESVTLGRIGPGSIEIEARDSRELMMERQNSARIERLLRETERMLDSTAKRARIAEEALEKIKKL
jgi:hypothetical protein